MIWNELKVTNNSPKTRSDTNTGYTSSIALGKGGVPYVAFQNTASAPIGRACLSHYDGVNWVPNFTDFSVQKAAYLQIKFSKDGTIGYIIYKQGLGSIIAKKLSCAGPSCNFLPFPDVVFPANAEHISLALAPDNTPYVVYGIPIVSGFEIHVNFFDGTNWTEIPSNKKIYADKANNPIPVENIAIAVTTEAGKNVPYVGFKDKISNFGLVKKYNQVTQQWVDVGGHFSVGADPQSICIVFDNSNTPWIAYSENDTNRLFFRQIQIQKFSSNTWEPVSTKHLTTKPSLTFDISRKGTVYLSCIDYLALGKLYVYSSTDNFVKPINNEIIELDTTQIAAGNNKILVARQNFDTFLNELPIEICLKP